MTHPVLPNYLDIVEFHDELYQPETPIPRVMPDPWKRWLRTAFTPDDQGYLPYSTVVISLPKKCMATGERIWLADGRFLPVEQLVGPQRVWAFNGEGYVEADAEVFDNGADDIAAITLRTGRVIRRTLAHPLLTWRGWRRVEELVVGDSIALPRAVPTPQVTKRLPEGLPAFIGYMIGDGGMTGLSTPKFSQLPGPLLDEMRVLCRRFGGDLHRISPKPMTCDYSVVGLVELFRQFRMLGKNSYQHSIPEEIFQAPDDQILQCLSALIATDGWVSAQRSSQSTSGSQIGYVTVSSQLAEDVCALWARLGQYPILRERPMPNGRFGKVCYEVFFGTAREIRELGPQLYLPGKMDALEAALARANTRTMDRFRYVDLLPREAWEDLFAAKERSGQSWNALGIRATPVPATWAPVRSKMAEWARACGDDALADRAEHTALSWDRIESIEHEGRGQTYGVSVPGFENYLAHEVSHNSWKTGGAALIVTWFAQCMAEDKGEIILVANKQIQSKRRAYWVVREAYKAHPLLAASCDFNGEEFLRTTRGVRITPITSEAGGEAGANPELIVMDETWAMHGEPDRRLWAELTPVSTRLNSIRLIVSYSGWLNYSDILHDVFKLHLKGEGHPDFTDMVDDDGHPVVRVNEKAGMLSIWDDQQRMPWQTDKRGRIYYRQQEETLPRAEFLRLHRNKWVSSEHGMDMDEWDACVDPEYRIPTPSKSIYLALGVDASWRKDQTAVVSLFLKDGVYCLGPWRVWQPERNVDFNIDKTAGDFVRLLGEGYSVREVYYDETQFHQIGLNLRQEGFMAVPFKQTLPNGRLMGQMLTDTLRNRQMRLTASKVLRGQAEQTSIVIDAQGVLLKKDNTNKKIDGIIALAMARVAAQLLPESGDSSSATIEVLG